MKLFDYDDADVVLKHPRHMRTLGIVAELIGRLRQCDGPGDYVAFQSDLLKHLLEVEEYRAGFSQVVKRMGNGLGPQAGAPEPEGGGDTAYIDTWKLERDVCERAARQLRSVGDALAWRSFDYQRQFILALCRNELAGPLANKAGLVAERAAVERVWKEDRRFAILHDLTTCLRIGDITVFSEDTVCIREIKTNPRRHSRAQLDRIQAAVQALWQHKALPGGDPRAWLLALDTPYAAHLDLLRLALEKANDQGLSGVKLSGRRALLATDLYGIEKQGYNEAEYFERFERRRRATLRRVHAQDAMELHVIGLSLDNTARDPRHVPWGCYPLDPMTCARIIGDLAIVHVEMSGPAVAEELRSAGINARWVLPPGPQSFELHPVAMHIDHGTTTLEVNRLEIDRYLMEMLKFETWANGIKELLAGRPIRGRQWPYYKGEHLAWA